MQNHSCVHSAQGQKIKELCNQILGALCELEEEYEEYIDKMTMMMLEPLPNDASTLSG
jgi:hypothetical protein